MPGSVSDYLQKTLEGELLLRESMHERCRLAVLFPVYREPIRRILELLESIADQEGVDFDEIEVLCLVNNAPDDGSRRYESVRRSNDLTLNLPVWRNHRPFAATMIDAEARARAHRLRRMLSAFVIDTSSPGNELADHSVGRARNRLLAESVYRFHRHRKNGIIVMTDADAVFSDRLYMQKVLRLFGEHTELVGGAGGIDFVFDPDATDEKTRARLHEDISRYILRRRWDCLKDKMLGREPDMAPADACYGANILCRSEAAAAAGGFRPLNRFEDSYFYKDLSRFASGCGKHTAPLPELRVQTALRESARTDSSFGHVLMRTDARHVKHPLSGKSCMLSEAIFRETASGFARSHEGRLFLRRLEHLPQVLYGNAFPV